MPTATRITGLIRPTLFRSLRRFGTRSRNSARKMRNCSNTNTKAFIDALTKKDEGWKKALEPFRGVKIVVVHDSWSYFAEHFGLQIVAAAEPHPGVPPSPAELAALFQRMRESNVKILVADPHANPALVRQIANQERRAGGDAVSFRRRLHSSVRRQRGAACRGAQACRLDRAAVLAFCRGTRAHVDSRLVWTARTRARRGVCRSVARASGRARSNRCDPRGLRRTE